LPKLIGTGCCVLPSGCLHRARRGELLNLWWRDVDLDAAEVRITGSNFQPSDL